MHSNSTTPPADLVELGRVLGAYGVRGWVKIEPHSPESDVLLNAYQWWLQGRPGGKSAHACAVRVLNARMHSGNIVAALDGVSTREDAAQLRGCTVHVSRSVFPPLPDDEYYWVDLIGCLVFGVDDAQADVEQGVAGEATGASAVGIVDAQVDAPAGGSASGDGAVLHTSGAAPGAGEVLLGRVTQVADNGAHAVLHVQRLGPDEQPLFDAKGRPLEVLVPFVSAHVHKVDLVSRRIDTDWPVEL